MLEQMNWRKFHPKGTEYTLFSSALPNIDHTFIDHILGHKTSLNMFKRPKIFVKCLFWPHGMKLISNHTHTHKLEIHKYVEIKQHAIEQTMGHRRNRTQ